MLLADSSLLFLLLLTSKMKSGLTCTRVPPLVDREGIGSVKVLGGHRALTSATSDGGNPWDSVTSPPPFLLGWFFDPVRTCTKTDKVSHSCLISSSFTVDGGMSLTCLSLARIPFP